LIITAIEYTTTNSSAYTLAYSKQRFHLKKPQATENAFHQQPQINC
jgi:hypothetical protein